jgi:cellulose synthase/poly-beta-1,6-N-acetylglucosamine synthase-like glycosyltransferase
MLVFLLQLRHLITAGGHLYLFTVYIGTVWALWVLKVVLGAGYKPWRASFDGTAAVVIPVVDEPLDLFADVLRRISEQRPHDALVVINGPENPALAAVCDEYGIRWMHTFTAGKRNAVREGVANTEGDIVVLVDSDTLWTTGTLPELMKPFNDAGVGGVTTRQRIIQPDRNILTRWADWLESVRCHYSFPAMSRIGLIGCLPGRTIAFRREILVRAMPDFMSEKFLGVFLEVSDDRTLTNYALKYGYRTVYQSTSYVLTDAPTHLRKLVKQQLRWSRGSQYNTLRMLPWMLAHAPILAIFYIADIALPFLLLGSALGWVERTLGYGDKRDLYGSVLSRYGEHHGFVLVALVSVGTSVLSVSLRQWRHLRERPIDLLFMPMFLLLSTFMLMPIRIVGFFRCAKPAGWGTRADAYSGDGAAKRGVFARLSRKGRVARERGSRERLLPAALGLALITGGILYGG